MEASFTIVFLLFIAAATAFWVWALVDVIRRPSGTLRAGSQAVWAVVIALTHAIRSPCLRARRSSPSGRIRRECRAREPIAVVTLTLASPSP